MRHSGSRNGSRTCCSSQLHRHRPFSLLWHVALFTTAATGPASCFVTMPTSATRLRGETTGGGSCSFFAAASPLPKVALGSLGGVARDSNSRRAYSAGRSGDHDVRDGREGGQNDATCAQPATTTSRNARGFRAVTALSEGVKGLKAAGMALRASATGVDLESRMPLADSKPKRILILMSDTGGGHRASSQALTAAITDLYGDQVHVCDMLRVLALRLISFGGVCVTRVLIAVCCKCGVCLFFMMHVDIEVQVVETVGMCDAGCLFIPIRQV